MIESYVFDNNEVGSLVYSYISLGKNITGAEVGAGAAQCSCCFLQKCHNISKIYVVDPFEQYYDPLQNKFFDVKEMEFIELTARHNIKYSGFQEKVELLKMNDEEAAASISDSSLDFVFLDVWVEENQIIPRLERWSAKVKPGGIVSGHDWHFETLRNYLKDFRKNQSLHNVNNTWMYFKD
jgi:hypothetical protein